MLENPPTENPMDTLTTEQFDALILLANCTVELPPSEILHGLCPFCLDPTCPYAKQIQDAAELTKDIRTKAGQRKTP